jgi:hypothetical protein
MRKLALALPVLLTALLAGPGLAAADTVFKASLTGDQEFPGPGNPDAKGTFRIAFKPDLASARITLTVIGLPGVIRAHLHCGIAGVAGPIFIHLIGDMPFIPGSTTERTPQNISGRWLSNATLTDQSFSNVDTECGNTLAELATAIAAGKVYANVHTNALPAGAIRGQLGK